jgi:hypothetical protein
VTTTQRFPTLVRRLSRLSTARGFDAYRDVAWDDDEMALDPADPRLELHDGDPLATTDWYRDLPAEERARIGLVRVAASFRTGWHFENLLQQGLLHRALYLPAGEPEFRYIHHELIEESQHTLMFEELVRRSGVAVRGMPWWLRRFTESLIRILSRHSPVVFFAMVLGGEEPLDLLQRRTLAAGTHPLVARVMGIHVAEEARHISYARAAIERDAATLNPLRRRTVAFFTPLVLGIMVRLMLRPTHDLEAAGVPRAVLVDMYRSEPGRRHLLDGVARIRELLIEEELVTPSARWMWRRLRIWD